jgi:transmembrane sensor
LTIPFFVAAAIFYCMPDEKEIAHLLSILKDLTQSDEVRHKALQQLLAHDEAVQSHLRKDFTAAIPESDETVAEASHAYDRLRQQLNFADQDQSPVKKMPRRISLYGKWASVAAAVLLLISGAWFFRQQLNKPSEIPTITATPIASITNTRFDTIRNNSASASFHRLQDGSTVQLEAHSYIAFRDSFPANKKEIFLKGSALFTVHKEANRPFSVLVNGLEVIDLGTVFSITTHENLVKVRLIQGKVLIHPVNTRFGLRDISLTPGQEFRIDTATHQYAVNTLSPEKLLLDSRLAKELTFKNAPLQEVFDKLEKECNISIDFNKADIKDKSFTGTIDAGSNARNIIKMICMVNDLNYELINNSIHIHQ